MEPPVQSFYGAEPIPLPSRFATIKRHLIQGREEAIEASWRRLLVALKHEIAHITRARASDLIPVIDFADLDDAATVALFSQDLKQRGVAVVRRVVSQEQTESWIQQTKDYITRNQDHIKPPKPHDPSCFDLFWTPAQCAIRAHPAVLRVQKWAMTFWETKGSEADLSRIVNRFPISYADRLRIHHDAILGVNAVPPLVGQSSAPSTLIAQVDNGSLERWEPDGYGRGGAYDAVFRGDWEALDPWDPSGRINVSQDLYNGAGVCSVFRMFQGLLALTPAEPAAIRVLPSPKLTMAYLLLRPFFSPTVVTSPPPYTPSGHDDYDDHGDEDKDKDMDDATPPAIWAQWDAYLDPDNWALDAEQSTIIHGAVPGHAQRITELWHPHLRLRRSLVQIPTLQVGDYVLWHCDTAYSIETTAATTASFSSCPSTTDTTTNSKAPPTLSTSTPAPRSDSDTPVLPRSLSAASMLIYTPACPLTQNNALYLARQRKALLLGLPGPDFDSMGGSTIRSEAPLSGRPGRDEIAAVGGEAGLQAMGLAPWELSPDGSKVVARPVTKTTGTPEGLGPTGGAEYDGVKDEVEEEEAEPAGKGLQGQGMATMTEGEAEVVRLANIILFPDRYDFYIPTERAGAAREPINGRAQAEQRAAMRQLISRIMS